MRPRLEAVVFGSTRDNTVMDIVSHAIVGLGIAGIGHARSSDALTISAFAIIPDIPQILLYLKLGFANHRPLWIPRYADWQREGTVRNNHPVWSSLYDIPHSMFFLLLVVIPVVKLYRFPSLAIVAYCSHIVLDLFTHTEEWAIKPLYPFSWKFVGVTDGWRWSVRGWMTSWAVLAGCLYGVVHWNTVTRYVVAVLACVRSFGR